MIAKGKSISHLTASIQYALKREEAFILDKNIAGDKPHQVAKEFKLFQNINRRCQRNSLSFVLSPTIADGEKLSFEQLETINKSFLEKMHLNNNQYIAFVHENTKHKHIHLYVNRIDYQGKAYNDQFISNKSAHTAECIAGEMGLQTAKELQKQRSIERQIEYPEMDRIKELAKEILNQRGVNTVAKFVDGFNEAGSEKGLLAEAYHNKQGYFQGLRFYADGHKFKASDVDRSLSKQNIEHALEQKQQLSLDKETSKGMGRSL